MLCQTSDAQRRNTLTYDGVKDDYLWKPHSARNNVTGNDCMKFSSSHGVKFKNLKT
jgi:hypothetical protein